MPQVALLSEYGNLADGGIARVEVDADTPARFEGLGRDCPDAWLTGPAPQLRAAQVQDEPFKVAEAVEAEFHHLARLG
jgi:hypothetical protein